ncbi:ATP-binding cassette domain-containing protein [Archangium lansingense]|uniref:ATP-binding cassette domain-containing protein n=1 Tax=Archangium lansingense TaxID=2995310 RepID=UPI003B806A6E
MAGELDALAWPLERAGDAMEALARAARLPLPNPLPALSHVVPGDPRLVDSWLDAGAQALGLELQPHYTRHGEVERVLRRAAPAIVEVTSAHGKAVIALLRLSSSGETARIIAPDETVHDVPFSTLSAASRARVEHLQGPVAERILERAGLPEPQRLLARRALLGAQLTNTYLFAARTLRLPPGARMLHHLRALRAGQRLLLLLLLTTIIQVCVLSSWWLVGRGAFEGRLDTGWLWAWALMGLTAVPLQAVLAWSQGSLAMELSALLRRQLLSGALALPVDEARRGGIGQYVGKTFESAGMEQLVLTGGFASLLAVVDVLLATSVMVTGPAGWYGLVALVGFCFMLGVLVVRQASRFRAWTDARVSMTHALIERMLGHRTRLAQEQPEKWHEAEDQELAHYAEASERLDAATARVSALAKRGLLPVVIIATLPAVLEGASTARIAVGVGAALLAARAVGSLSIGALSLSGARVLYRGVRPILEAARRSGSTSTGGPASLPSPEASPPKTHALLEVRDLVFKHAGAPRAVLEGASLSVRAGERVLLEGPSGSGKSTFASIVTGLRGQGSGLMLLGGLDMATWTQDGWGAQIASAPQFHENHVVSGSLALNLLLGRAWPPTPEDLNSARILCEELGLGELLGRMPSGLMQLVGERGWQLSHGEQSRVFVARALLQRARVVVLDEAFGALDPVTMRKVMTCVEARASTLIVIAHP